MQSNKAIKSRIKFNYTEYNMRGIIFSSIFSWYLYRIDSAMLVEEGFEVVSVDASDKMLKYALKERWNRRKEPGFDNWSKWYPFLCISSFTHYFELIIFGGWDTFILLYFKLLRKPIG